MRRLIIFPMLLAASTALGQGKPGLLLIGNKSEDSLSFVDVRTQKEVARATTGRGPHEVAVTPDGKKAFVSNYEGPGDSISIVDVSARKELRRLPLGEHRAPHGIAVSRDGRRVYATCERSQTVIEIDVATEKIVRTFKTDQKGTHMLVLTPDGKKLYTGNMGSGTATVIDLVKGEVLAQIKTGANCEGIRCLRSSDADRRGKDRRGEASRWDGACDWPIRFGDNDYDCAVQNSKKQKEKGMRHEQILRSLEGDRVLVWSSPCRVVKCAAHRGVRVWLPVG